MDVMYHDFFGPSPNVEPFSDEISQQMSRSSRLNELAQLQSYTATNLTEVADEMEGVDEDEDDVGIDSSKRPDVEDIFKVESGGNEAGESTYEKEQERLRKQITLLEAEALAPKHWALSGEVSAKHRPVDSLLEADILDIEPASKPVPIPTEETTQSLEELIKQRIKDSVFDDVERKLAPVEREYDPNRRIEILETKPNKSLAEEYEAEFMKQTGGGTTVTAKDTALKASHDEISVLFKSLCQDLDALSNWHFAPKLSKDDLIINTIPTVNKNVPSIALEEATPASVSDAQLAAPKEVYDGKLAKGNSEMVASDKKRQRTTKQRIFKQRKLEKMNREKALEALASKNNSTSEGKRMQKKALEQLMKTQNVTIIGAGGHKSLVEKDDSVKSKGDKNGSTKGASFIKGGSSVGYKNAGKRKLANMVDKGGAVKSKGDNDGLDANMLRL
ncbi:hypothetical protein SeLEV6574_g02155 [Synchytrium endobioticum]|nr:hypothetical protein SeLEV6574_g02155 [Synchytrium endobioticum]